MATDGRLLSKDVCGDAMAYAFEVLGVVWPQSGQEAPDASRLKLTRAKNKKHSGWAKGQAKEVP